MASCSLRALLAACVFAAAVGGSALRGPGAQHLTCCAGIASTNEAVVESQTVADLADRLGRLKVELKGWEGKRRQVGGFQKKQMKNVERQLETGKKKNADHAASMEEVGKTQQETMKQHMCTLIFNAHLMFDSDAEQRLGDLCLGRQALSMASVRSHSEVSTLKPLLKESKDPFEPTRDLFDKVVDSENILKLKARGRDLRETVKETREGYYADMVKFSKEREEASAEVDDVDEDYVDQRIDTWSEKDEAWDAVKGDFCPSIESGPDKAVETATAKCKAE